MKKNILFPLLLLTHLYSNNNVPFGIKSNCPTYITEDDYTMCYDDNIKNVSWISYTKEKRPNVNNLMFQFSLNNLINKSDERIYRKYQTPILTEKELKDSGYIVYSILPDYLQNKDSELLSLSILLYPNVYQNLKNIDKYENELLLTKKINIIRGIVPSKNIFIGKNMAIVPSSIYVIIYEFDKQNIQTFLLKNDNSISSRNIEDLKFDLKELEKLTTNKFFIKNRAIRKIFKEELND